MEKPEEKKSPDTVGNGYWSAVKGSATTAWYVSFGNGYVGTTIRGTGSYVGRRRKYGKICF